MKRSAALALVLLGLGSAAHALEFQPLGSGSVGVGGAGVARNFGAMAPYWNPAGLAFAPRTVTVSLTGQVGIEPHGKLAEDLDNLNKTYNAWNGNQTSIPAGNTLAGAFNDLVATTAKDNLHVTAGAALGAQVKHVGFGAYGTFEGGSLPNAGGTAIPVPINAQLTQPVVDAALASKTVTLRGIGLLEVPVSYGHAFDLGAAGKVGVGASVKYLHGWATAESNRAIFDTVSKSVVSSSDLTKDLKKNLHDSSAVGFDVGLLWKPSGSTSLGLVGKNLNSPSFSTKTGEKIPVGRQVRAGASWDPLSWLELTADVDVFSNSTIVSGLNSQTLGGGAEFHPFSCLKLRAGGYTNLAASANGALTAGFSLGAPLFFFDLDAAYGLGTVRYNKDSYPSEAKVQFSMNLAF